MGSRSPPQVQAGAHCCHWPEKNSGSKGINGGECATEPIYIQTTAKNPYLTLRNKTGRISGHSASAPIHASSSETGYVTG